MVFQGVIRFNEKWFIRSVCCFAEILRCPSEQKLFQLIWMRYVNRHLY